MSQPIEELVQEVRGRVSAALTSRERAGIPYRSLQVSTDDLLRLCDAAVGHKSTESETNGD